MRAAARRGHTPAITLSQERNLRIPERTLANARASAIEMSRERGRLASVLRSVAPVRTAASRTPLPVRNCRNRRFLAGVKPDPTCAPPRPEPVVHRCRSFHHTTGDDRVHVHETSRPRVGGPPRTRVDGDRRPGRTTHAGIRRGDLDSDGDRDREGRRPDHLRARATTADSLSRGFNGRDSASVTGRPTPPAP